MADQVYNKTLLWKRTENLARNETHTRFRSTCLDHLTIPKGMTVKFGVDALPKSEFLHTRVQYTVRSAGLDILQACLTTYRSMAEKERSPLELLVYNIHQTHGYHEGEAVRRYQRRLASNLRRKYWKTKMKKTRHNPAAANTTAHQTPREKEMQTIQKIPGSTT